MMDQAIDIRPPADAQDGPGYSLRATAGGQVEVIEHRQVVIGIFAEERHARLFHGFMAGRYLRLEAAPTAEVEPAPLAEAADERVAVSIAIRADAPPDRIERVKAAIRAASANQHAAIPLEEQEPEECRLCGREFVPSASAPDLCARCSRGV